MKGQRRSDSSSQRPQEESDSQRQNAGWGGWVPGMGEGNEKFCLTRTEFQLGKTKSILEMDGGDGCLTL